MRSMKNLTKTAFRLLPSPSTFKLPSKTMKDGSPLPRTFFSYIMKELYTKVEKAPDVTIVVHQSFILPGTYIEIEKVTMVDSFD